MNTLERRLAIADKAINLGLTSAELKDQIIDWHLFGIKNTVSASIIEERVLEVKRLRKSLTKCRRIEQELISNPANPMHHVQHKLAELQQAIEDSLNRLEK